MREEKDNVLEGRGKGGESGQNEKEKECDET